MQGRRSSGRAAWLVLSLSSLTLAARAGWVELPLPNLSGAFAPLAMDHLPDGRFLYAESGQFLLQDGFGSPAATAFTGEPFVDPSFIAVLDATRAVAGGGGFGTSDLYRFDPAAPAAPGFAALGLDIQNFQAVPRDAAGLYVGGIYTGVTHGVRYVAADGSVSKVIIENISTYSGGLARDAAGNLYVGDNDDGRVVRFSAAQLAGAIAGAPLDMGEGEFIHDFGGGGHIGSLAVDARGRVWATGWMQDGLRMYDPWADVDLQFIPGPTNANYTVLNFQRGGVDYVAYINQANPFAGGTAMRYGYVRSGAAPAVRAGDLDGDFVSDCALFRPAGHQWFTMEADGDQGAFTSGEGWTVPLAADFDADYVAETAWFRPDAGQWLVHNFGPPAPLPYFVQWGWARTVPVVGDYDGDGVADIAVWDPVAGLWYVRKSGGGMLAYNWGWSKSVPVPGDYDDDGLTDLAVYAPAQGNWYVKLSGGGTLVENWGWKEAQPAPGDYDGDGRTDLAVYHAKTGAWYIRRSAGGFETLTLGARNESPVPADYDGDGLVDPAVLQRDTGLWRYRRSRDGQVVTRQFGWSETEPVHAQWQINRWMNQRLQLWPVP